MKLALPFTEALALATATAPLPPMVQSLRCEGSTLHAEVDLRAIRTPSLALRLALAAGGIVTVTARLDEYSDGVASIAITAHTRGLPAHRLLPHLLDTVNAAIDDAGLPEGLVRVRRGDSEPLVLIDLQKAVDSRTRGLTIKALELRDAVIHVDARIEDFGLEN